MKFDVGLFTCQNPDWYSGNVEERYQDLLAFGSYAEEQGFEKAWVSEHHFVEDGYLPAVLPFCAALGARTDSLKVGTGIALGPFYDPIRFAEDTAVIQLTTGGRFEVGLAIGWTEAEFETFDVPERLRVPYTEELIEILDKAWSDEPITHDGHVYHYEDVDVHPKPAQEPSIWLAGTVDAAVKRAARLGDGYFATPTPLDELIRRRELADSVSGEQGKGSIELAEWRYTYVSEDGDAWETAKQSIWHIKRQYIQWATGEPQPEKLPEEMEEDLREECLVGTPNEVHEQVRERRDALGEDYRLVCRVTLPGLPIEKVRESTRLLGEQVMPGFTD